MSDSQIPDKTLLNSIIGEGTRFRGEFDLNGLLRIDGDFSGTIRTKGKVLVGSNGRVECRLYAGTVVIGGIVRGDIYSTEKVTILSTGMVIGNIHTPRLIMEEGVIFDGKCHVLKGSAHAELREDPVDTADRKSLFDNPEEETGEGRFEVEQQKASYQQNETAVSI